MSQSHEDQIAREEAEGDQGDVHWVISLFP